MKFNFWAKTLATQAILLAMGAAGFCSQASNALFTQGVNLLNNRRYEESVACLSKVARENPKNALAHYYLAIGLVHLGKISEAKQQFFACYCLDPEGQAGKYAQVALSTYQLEEKSGLAEAANVEQERLQLGSVGNKAEDENFKKTLAVIRQQAQLEKNRKASAGESMVSGATATAEGQVNRIQDSSLQTLGVSPYVGLSDKSDNHFKSNAQPGSSLAQAEESIRIARMAAKQKSAEYRSWSNAQEKR